jgi:hypothetical protein
MALFKKDNIHDLNDEMFSSLLEMLNSRDAGDVKLAVDVLNNVNLNDKANSNYLSSLISDCPYLYFDVDIHNVTHSFELNHIAISNPAYFEKINQK